MYAEHEITYTKRNAYKRLYTIFAYIRTFGPADILQDVILGLLAREPLEEIEGAIDVRRGQLEFAKVAKVTY